MPNRSTLVGRPSQCVDMVPPRGRSYTISIYLRVTVTWSAYGHGRGGPSHRQSISRQGSSFFFFSTTTIQVWLHIHSHWRDIPLRSRSNRVTLGARESLLGCGRHCQTPDFSQGALRALYELLRTSTTSKQHIHLCGRLSSHAYLRIRLIVPSLGSMTTAFQRVNKQCSNSGQKVEERHREYINIHQGRYIQARKS